VIFGLVASSVSALAMGFVSTFGMFFVLALTVGILGDIAGPAHNAMVADILPEEKRAQGYGIIRVAFNLSAAIGPAIGGLLAANSYLALFVADAVISLITACLSGDPAETKPEPQAGASGSGRHVWRFPRAARPALPAVHGRLYLYDVGLHDMNTTRVYVMRTASPSQVWLILSLNAVMVVLFQFGITRRIEKRPPLLMMALGSALYAIGFAMYGFVSTYLLFLLAMVIITVGEMVVAPVGQALVQNCARRVRGRYMAVFGYSWGISFMIGPYLAGLVLDNFDPRFLWYAAGMIGALAVLGFLGLHRRVEANEDSSQPATIQPV
jgi:MFS family permease